MRLQRSFHSWELGALADGYRQLERVGDHLRGRACCLLSLR